MDLLDLLVLGLDELVELAFLGLEELSTLLLLLRLTDETLRGEFHLST